MGAWGYAPKDGDAPHDLESNLNHEAIAPYLIKLFKKPMRKGSQKFVHPEVMAAELEKAGIKRPWPKQKGGMVDRRTLRAFMKKFQEMRRKITRRKDSSLFCEIQDASHDRWKRLGLVQILSERNVGIPVSVVMKCRSYLRELSKDEGFASTWDKPKVFKKAVANMLENVELILARDKIGQAQTKKRREKCKGRIPVRRQRGPRLIYEPFFRDRPGERRIPGCLKLLPIPDPPYRRAVRKRRRASKKVKKAIRKAAKKAS